MALTIRPWKFILLFGELLLTWAFLCRGFTDVEWVLPGRFLTPFASELCFDFLKTANNWPSSYWAKLSDNSVGSKKSNRFLPDVTEETATPPHLMVYSAEGVEVMVPRTCFFLFDDERTTHGDHTVTSSTSNGRLSAVRLDLKLDSIKKDTIENPETRIDTGLTVSFLSLKKRDASLSDSKEESSEEILARVSAIPVDDNGWIQQNRYENIKWNWITATAHLSNSSERLDYLNSLGVSLKETLDVWCGKRELDLQAIGIPKVYHLDRIKTGHLSPEFSVVMLIVDVECEEKGEKRNINVCTVLVTPMSSEDCTQNDVADTASITLEVTKRSFHSVLKMLENEGDLKDVHRKGLLGFLCQLGLHTRISDGSVDTISPLLLDVFNAIEEKREAVDLIPLEIDESWNEFKLAMNTKDGDSTEAALRKHLSSVYKCNNSVVDIWAYVDERIKTMQVAEWVPSEMKYSSDSFNFPEILEVTQAHKDIKEFGTDIMSTYDRINTISKELFCLYEIEGVLYELTACFDTPLSTVRGLFPTFELWRLSGACRIVGKVGMTDTVWFLKIFGEKWPPEIPVWFYPERLQHEVMEVLQTQELKDSVTQLQDSTKVQELMKAHEGTKNDITEESMEKLRDAVKNLLTTISDHMRQIIQSVIRAAEGKDTTTFDKPLANLKKLKQNTTCATVRFVSGLGRPKKGVPSAVEQLDQTVPSAAKWVDQTYPTDPSEAANLAYTLLTTYHGISEMRMENASIYLGEKVDKSWRAFSEGMKVWQRRADLTKDYFSALSEYAESMKDEIWVLDNRIKAMREHNKDTTRGGVSGSLDSSELSYSLGSLGFPEGVIRNGSEVNPAWVGVSPSDEPATTLHNLSCMYDVAENILPCLREIHRVYCELNFWSTEFMRFGEPSSWISPNSITVSELWEVAGACQLSRKHDLPDSAWFLKEFEKKWPPDVIISFHAAADDVDKVKALETVSVKELEGVRIEPASNALETLKNDITSELVDAVTRVRDTDDDSMWVFLQHAVSVKMLCDIYDKLQKGLTEVENHRLLETVIHDCDMENASPLDTPVMSEESLQMLFQIFLDFKRGDVKTIFEEALRLKNGGEGPPGVQQPPTVDKAKELSNIKESLTNYRNEVKDLLRTANQKMDKYVRDLASSATDGKFNESLHVNTVKIHFPDLIFSETSTKILTVVIAAKDEDPTFSKLLDQLKNPKEKAVAGPGTTAEVDPSDATLVFNLMTQYKGIIAMRNRKKGIALSDKVEESWTTLSEAMAVWQPTGDLVPDYIAALSEYIESMKEEVYEWDKRIKALWVHNKDLCEGNNSLDSLQFRDAICLLGFPKEFFTKGREINSAWGVTASENDTLHTISCLYDVLERSLPCLREIDSVQRYLSYWSVDFMRLEKPSPWIYPNLTTESDLWEVSGTCQLRGIRQLTDNQRREKLLYLPGTDWFLKMFDKNWPPDFLNWFRSAPGDVRAILKKVQGTESLKDSLKEVEAVTINPAREALEELTRDISEEFENAVVKVVNILSTVDDLELISIGDALKDTDKVYGLVNNLKDLPKSADDKEVFSVFEKYWNNVYSGFSEGEEFPVSEDNQMKLYKDVIIVFVDGDVIAILDEALRRKKGEDTQIVKPVEAGMVEKLPSSLTKYRHEVEKLLKTANKTMSEYVWHLVTSAKDSEPNQPLLVDLVEILRTHLDISGTITNIRSVIEQHYAVTSDNKDGKDETAKTSGGEDGEGP